jgi:hypothetical protein
MMPVAHPNVIPALVSSLVVWRVYRRIRRNVGRQEFQPRRTLIRIAIFGLITISIAIAVVRHPAVLFGYAGGLLAGAVLAFVGLRLTYFDSTPEGRFYTPNVYIGVVLSLLLIARLAYRLLTLYSSPSVNSLPPSGMLSPVTLLILGLTAGYYIVYFTGIFMRCRAPQLAQSETVTPPV